MRRSISVSRFRPRGLQENHVVFRTVAAQKPSRIPQRRSSVLKHQPTLRDQLVGELKEIASSDDAAIWARRILVA
jgi:hypothetical protein